MINIIISSDPRYKINRDLIRQVVSDVVSDHRIIGRVEIGVNIVGDRKIHELNRRYRGIDEVTDVLSFPLLSSGRLGFIAPPDKILRLGDIVISYRQAVDDASYDGISVDEEIADLVEHGMTHLLGINHQEVS